MGDSVQWRTMEINLLAFETSSSRCGVALLTRRAGSTAIAVREHEGAQEHAERMLPMAHELLEAAGLAPGDLDAVAFGQGPGGFTGLRVACGVAQGVAMGLDLPVVPVVSHLAVAQATHALPGQVVLVALDARMEEVYLAAYRRLPAPQVPAAGPSEAAGWETLHAPLLIAAGEVCAWAAHHLPAGARVVAAGDAWTVYAAQMPLPEGWQHSDEARPSARALARLAELALDQGMSVAPEMAAPLYVRDKVAFTTAERERGEGGNPRARAQVPEAPALRLAPMRPADLDQVAALEAQVQAFPWTRGNFSDALLSGYASCVAWRGDALCGFCLLMMAPDVSHLLVIAVQRDLQRQGVGTALMEWCEAQSRAAGVEGVLLEVRPSNPGAVAFYEHHGYVRIGVRKDYYPAGKGTREDAWVMQKPLKDTKA